MSRARASRKSRAPRRRSATGSCARVPEDQSARLPITGRHVIGRSEPATLVRAERKVAGPGARRATTAVREHRRRARRVTGATSSGRPAPRARSSHGHQPARPRLQDRRRDHARVAALVRARAYGTDAAAPPHPRDSDLTPHPCGAPAPHHSIRAVAASRSS